MNRKFLKGIWLTIILLFIGMETYHVIVGNYNDVIISLLIVVVSLSLLGVYLLIKKPNKK